MATSINYVPSTESDFSGPAWNNSNEYPSLTSNEFTYDRHQFDSLITRIEETLTTINGLIQNPNAPINDNDAQTLATGLQAICEMEEQATILLSNMTTFASCLTCIDGSNSEARFALSQLTQLSGQLEALTKPVTVYLTHAPETILTAYFQHAHVKPYEFQVRYRRQVADTMLSDAEESLLARLKANGPMAFGALYDQLSSSIRCHYEDPTTKEIKVIGLAQAAGLLRDANAAKRKAAWHSIQNGWKTQETSAAAILNSLAGWRLEMNEQRSKKRRTSGKESLHFLDLPLHDMRIQRATLEAMMSAVTSRREVGYRAARGMAKAMGKTKLDPWDLLAPAPLSATAPDSRLSFEKGIGLIRAAFDTVDPSLSDFVDTMKKNRWIEGRQLPNKRPGAFCTRYAKSNSPRVYQTYMGSLEDIRTLAHELGHAYHSWVMRDLPSPLTKYPMTIAETASIFAETAFSDSLLSQAREKNDRHAALEIAWQNAESAVSFLLNIPARFEFETSFYERRKQGYVSADELNALMQTAWEKWFGPTLTDIEKQYWMTKLHFSIPTVSFYNFPYTFGALFSLGIYALRKERGADFWPSYIALLRDTGRMTAEDLAQKHLGADLTKEDFWLRSLAIIGDQVTEFENLI